MSAAIGNRSSPILRLYSQYKATDSIVKHYVLLSSASSASAGIAAEGKHDVVWLALYYVRALPPAQRLAEVLGTRVACAAGYIVVNLHYAPLVGIGSGQRQLIAVPCLAEHA